MHGMADHHQGRRLRAKAAEEVAEHTKGNPDRHHDPAQEKKAREEMAAPDAVWLHGTLKVHVRRLSSPESPGIGMNTERWVDCLFIVTASHNSFTQA